MGKEEILNFITENLPSFSKNNEKGYCMFTTTTQHQYAGSIEELIVLGISIIRDKPILQYPTLTELMGMKTELDKTYKFRMSDIGTNPHYIKGMELDKYRKFNKTPL